MSSIVTIKDLEKTYISDSETLTVLSGLNLEIAQGTKVAVVGESGSGKSTLLNILGGIDTFNKGSVVCGKYDLSKMKENQFSDYRSFFTGFIFQFHYLLKDFTALENVYLPSYVAGLSKKEAISRAEALLKDVGVYERRNHLPSELSGGERQRVSVARALINNPQLILADEPTGNLDPGNAALISDLLFDMVNKYNKTLLLVTHDMKIARKADICYSISNHTLEEVKWSNE